MILVLMIALAGFIGAALWSLNVYRRFNFPGPKPLPIIGNLHKISSDPHEFYTQMMRMSEQYAKETGFFALWGGTHLMVMVTGASHIERVLTNTTLITKGFQYDFMKPWIGEGLLVSTGSKWHSRRKLLTPAFHFKILDIFLNSFNKHSLKLVEVLRDKLGEIFDIAPIITLATLDIICETAMGIELKAMEKPDSEYVTAVKRISTLFLKRNFSIWLWPNFIFKLTSTGKRQNECLNILHSFTKNVIKEKRNARAECPPEIDEFGRKKYALLDLLLEAEESNQIDCNDIKEEVDTFMFEGHDTTSTTLLWMIYLVALHNDVQERIFNEIVDALGNSLTDISSQDLPKLKFLDCVIKESLRLYATVPSFSRTVTELITLGEQIIPVGSTLIIFTSSLHRDPKHYKDPNKFDPDRWLKENNLNKNPFAFIPFSAGMRNCIGQKFAMMEMKVVMVWLVRSFKISSNVKETDVSPILDIILKPKNGVKVYLEERV